MDKLIDAQISTIAQYGLLGALFIISLVVVWVLAKRLEKSQADRLADWREVGAIAKNDATVMANWTTSNDARTRALEKSAESQALAAAAQTALASSVATLVGEVADLKGENQRMREALIKHGVAM